ncbi:transposase-like protein [Arthrobacter sp. CAN_A214]
MSNVWPLTTVQTCVIHLIRKTFKLSAAGQVPAFPRRWGNLSGT